MSKLVRCLLFGFALALLPLTPASEIVAYPAAAGAVQGHVTRSRAAHSAHAAAPLAKTRHSALTLKWVLTNEGPNPVRDLELYVPIPGDRDNQRLSGLTFSEPYHPLTDQYGQRVARFQFREVAAGEQVTVSWTADVEIEAKDYHVDPARVGRLDEIPAHIRRTYTRDEAQYRLDSELIRRVAKEAAGGTTNAYWMARNIHDFVADRLAYDLDGKWGDAEAVYRQKTGSCSEYTFLFVALARANGLPARYVAGTVLPRKAPYVDTVFHRWAEVYLPRVGWVPVDVTHDDRKNGVSDEYFAAVTDERFVTTVGGGNSDYLGWMYHSGFRYRYSGQKPEISVERSFRWTPGAPELAARATMASRRVPARGSEIYLGQITLLGLNGAGDWSAQPGASWLHLDSRRGLTPATIRLYADTAHLAPGPHTADLCFTSPATGARATVPVSVYAVSQPSPSRTTAIPTTPR